MQLHKDDPSVFMGDTATTDAGLFSGLSQQAGAQWWSASGCCWPVGINSAASQKVASFWGNLVQQGALDSQTAWTASWDKSFSSGEYASWISAVWAPGDLASQAANTSGKWAMAALPQWTAGQNVDGAWGGSATSVTSNSKHPQQAAEFIAWLNDSGAGHRPAGQGRRHLPGRALGRVQLLAAGADLHEPVRLLHPGQAVLRAAPRPPPGART